MSEQQTHVRVTGAVFPATFVIPLTESVTITQYHVPVDDTHTYWYSIFTSFDQPLDAQSMREQRLRCVDLPDYLPKAGRHNHWGFNSEEQRTSTYLGMGEDDINVHDQWAVESMGAIQDRSREHLGTSDKVIMANRRLLLQSIEARQQGQPAPGVAQASIAQSLQGVDTLDGIGPTERWSSWWQEAALRKRQGAPWSRQEPVAQA